MGRIKSNFFGCEYLSETTIKAIQNDIVRYAEIVPDNYDWQELVIRVPLAGSLQRRRVKDTIRKLCDYLNSPYATMTEYKTATGTIHILTCVDFAKITGRNIKTVYDWAKKDIIDTRNTYGQILINVEYTINKLKKNQLNTL